MNARRNPKHVLVALAASIAAVAVPTTASAIDVAENLLINLDASTLSPGPVSSWSSNGSIGGAFTNDFLAPNSNPFVSSVGGVSRAVIFNGNDAIVSDVTTPAGLTGTDPTRTIEVWAYNPSLAGEEAMVTWAKRWGPDGSAMQFNFGNNADFGAVTHWAGGDIGWGAAAPTAGQWHHLAYTFDGNTQTTRVYVDGVETNAETLAPGAINTHANYNFRLGAALTGNEAGLEIFASLALAKVRVHDGVLTAEQVANNYNEEKPAFATTPPQPVVASNLRAGPKHRYSFDGTGGDGAQLTDSVSGAHGVLRAPDASALNGSGQMSLAGGPSASAGYGDLPNNLISGLSEVTLEAWVTPTAARNWMRIADFGSTTEGEHAGPGGGGNGADYLMMSATRGGDLNAQRGEIANNDPVGGGPAGANLADANVATNLNEQVHMALVYAQTGEFGPEIRLYRDGQLIISASTEIALANLNDVNNWLGRSNWTGDENFQGLFDEFRIYDYALSSGEVLGNFNAGANAVAVPEPGTLSVLLGGAAGLLGSRRRRRGVA